MSQKDILRHFVMWWVQYFHIDRTSVVLVDFPKPWNKPNPGSFIAPHEIETDDLYDWKPENASSGFLNRKGLDDSSSRPFYLIIRT